jgi:hypothetical protein
MCVGGELVWGLVVGSSQRFWVQNFGGSRIAPVAFRTHSAVLCVELLHFGERERKKEKGKEKRESTLCWFSVAASNQASGTVLCYKSQFKDYSLYIDLSMCQWYLIWQSRQVPLPLLPWTWSFHSDLCKLSVPGSISYPPSWSPIYVIFWELKFYIRGSLECDQLRTFLSSWLQCQWYAHLDLVAWPSLKVDKKFMKIICYLEIIWNISVIHRHMDCLLWFIL